MCPTLLWGHRAGTVRMIILGMTFLPMPPHSPGKSGSQVTQKHLQACKVKSWDAEQDWKAPRWRHLRNGNRKDKQCQPKSSTIPKQKFPPGCTLRELWDFVFQGCTLLSGWVRGIHTAYSRCLTLRKKPRHMQPSQAFFCQRIGRKLPKEVICFLSCFLNNFFLSYESKHTPYRKVYTYRRR